MNINTGKKIIQICYNLLPLKKKNKAAVSAAKTTLNTVFKEQNTVQKPNFCTLYWSNAIKSGAIKQGNKTNVELHEHLNGINHFFISGANPQNMDKKVLVTKLTPKEMIYQTDKQFKELMPTNKKMIVFRCIGEKPDFFSEYPLYKKRLNIKKGDVINMREYAYATSDIEYAKRYMQNNRGILYEIEIPEGARVSRIGNLGKTDEIAFPRSSNHECTEINHIVDENSDYIHIKLRYLPAKEPWRCNNYENLT